MELTSEDHSDPQEALVHDKIARIPFKRANTEPA